MIKYKDIAYTNVNNTESTDTIEEIKTFIRNFSENNIEITNGNILTNKESGVTIKSTKEKRKLLKNPRRVLQ